MKKTAIVCIACLLLAVGAAHAKKYPQAVEPLIAQCPDGKYVVITDGKAICNGKALPVRYPKMGNRKYNKSGESLKVHDRLDYERLW